jgi:integrase
MRVSEVCSLKVSDLHWSHGRWIVRFRVKGGRERTLPVPDEVRTAIKDYLKLDEARRRNLHSDGDEAFLFQPLVNYRTLEFARAPLDADGAEHRPPLGRLQRGREGLAA